MRPAAYAHIGLRVRYALGSPLQIDFDDTGDCGYPNSLMMLHLGSRATVLSSYHATSASVPLLS